MKLSHLALLVLLGAGMIPDLADPAHAQSAGAAGPKVPVITPVPGGPPDTWQPGTVTGGRPWKLLWADEFNGSTIDPSTWSYDSAATGWSNDWNNEWQDYTTGSTSGTGGANAFIADDGSATGNHMLVLRALRSKSSNAMHSFTSAKLQTKGKKWFPQGTALIAARLALPRGNGIWPAFWMVGKKGNWPASGEIDIMEQIAGAAGESRGGGDNTSFATLHWADDSGAHQQQGQGTKSVNLQSFHVYWAERRDSTIRMGIDDTCTFTMDLDDDQKELKQAFFVILNLAVGGNWGGFPDESTTFPQDFLVDWVRVYQP